MRALQDMFEIYSSTEKFQKNCTLVPQFCALKAPALPSEFYAGCYNTQSYTMF